MKYKVKVRALSLKGNKVVKFGAVIDSSQLPNPDNAEQMEKDGYIESVDLDEVEEVEETEEVEGDLLLNKEELEAMNKKDVKKYAKENDIDFDRQANKAELIDEILKNSGK